MSSAPQHFDSPTAASTTSAVNGCRSACSTLSLRRWVNRSLRRCTAPSWSAHAERVEFNVYPHWLPVKLMEELFAHLVVPLLHASTFVKDFPVDTSPLTREHRSAAGLVEKWDLYIRSVESATAYSELVDPVVQRERFEAQAALAAAGDDEAMPLDEDFLGAMEYGMPPSGGMGMGIDRLLMALTGAGIRETILFPLVRPQ
jgi:lysyl-tRNA synthetase, class II